MGNRPGGFIYKLKHRKAHKALPVVKAVEVIDSTNAPTNLETFILVWLDPNIDASQENVQTQARLREILTCLITFDRVKTCEEWLKKCPVEEKIILIVSGAYGQEIVPRIHDAPSIVAIYVYCLDVSRNEIWAKNFSKIRSVQSSTTKLLHELSHNQYNLENVEDSKALQIYQGQEQVYSLDVKTASLIWYQLFLEILISSGYLSSPSTKDELLEIFRQYNSDDQYGSHLIDEFERTYRSNQAIVWLTRNTLLSRTTNKALREQDLNMIFPLRFLLIDIYKQLIEHQAPSLNAFKIQLMSQAQMEDLRAHPGQFVVFHGFLFASTNLTQLKSTITYNDQYETVLFDIKANTRPGVAPFVYLREIDKNFDEQIDREVLFMCGSIFEVGSLQHDGSIWTLQLRLIGEPDIPILANMKQKLKDNRHMNIIGELLRQCGQNEKAIQFLQRVNNEVSAAQETRSKKNKLLLTPVENISFILINLREHMTDFTTAILKILNSYASKFILTIDDYPSIDFSQWSKQSATIFTTAQSVPTFQNIPKHFTLNLYDVHNTNVEQPRFMNIETLFGRLVDEVIEKYRNSSNENNDSTTSSIQKRINRIHSELEHIYEKYHSTSSSTLDCPAPVLILFILDRAYDNEELRLIEQQFGSYFSSVRYISDEQECLTGKETMDIFMILCGSSNESIGNRLQQMSTRVKYLHYYEESRENNKEGMITNANDLRYRIVYDLIEYYGNLGKEYQTNKQLSEARRMFLKHEIYVIFYQMCTIDGIQIDTDYLQSTFQFLLLNDQYSNHSGPTPVIPLRHASFFTFIQVFKDLMKCQRYVRVNNEHLCTLFISNGKIIEWNQTNDKSHKNIHQVYIFCRLFSDYLAMKKWTGCYRKKIRDVFLSDTVDYELLKLGIDHIQRILPEFPEPALRRKLNCHARDMAKALANYFQEEIDNIDVQPSAECSEMP